MLAISGDRSKLWLFSSTSRLKHTLPAVVLATSNIRS
jgi:hypothetical protein